MRTITLVVPEGTEAGDSLCFTVDGQDVEVPLPEGAKAGDAIQIGLQIDGRPRSSEDSTSTEAGDDKNGANKADADDAANDELSPSERSTNNGDVCKVPLHSSMGAELTLKVSLDSTTASADAIHSKPWPTGIVMTKVLTHPTISKRIISCLNDAKGKIRALELGSGLGTVGLALARVLTRNEAEVVLTDYESTIPLLQVNIEANQPIFHGKVDVKAESLEWGQLSSDMSKFDIICGSDLLYGAESSYQPLVDTISALLSKESDGNKNGGIVLLGVRWRKPDKERKFFELADRSGIEFMLLREWLGDLGVVDEETMILPDMPTLDWKHYGDVDNEAFLQHCSNTRVSTGGEKRTVSLMDLSETDMEDMNDAEHASFERTQIQIYVGTWKRREGPKRAVPEGEVDNAIAKKTKI